MNDQQMREYGIEQMAEMAQSQMGMRNKSLPATSPTPPTPGPTLTRMLLDIRENQYEMNRMLDQLSGPVPGPSQNNRIDGPEPVMKQLMGLARDAMEGCAFLRERLSHVVEWL